jgi:predicted transcriptional regulator
MKKLVKELMTDNFVKVNEDEWIYEALSQIAVSKKSMLVCVVDKEDKLCGIITPKEALRAVEVCGYDGAKHPLFSGREVLHLMTSKYAKDIMSAPVFVKTDDEAQQAIDIMIDRGFYEVPVVDDASKPIGLVTYFGIVSSSIWHCDMEK